MRFWIHRGHAGLEGPALSPVGKEKSSPRPNERKISGSLAEFFQRIWAIVVAPKKVGFFCCANRRRFRRIAGNAVWTAPRPDIGLGDSVQKIFKKVKKRLVSPLKPR
jgi:hypothetical protein